MADVMTFPDTVDEFMEQYKLVDEDHVYSNGVAFIPVFRMKQWFEHLQALPITNADRIRNMNDNELADWLTALCWYPVEKYGIEPVKDWWVDWLKRDSEEWKKV